MPIIYNAKGVQFWKDVNLKLDELGKSVEDIHDMCPELAISTLKKWQNKGALPASEHICLIKTCLDQWEETVPEQVNEVQAGENPMVMDTNEVEKLKTKIAAQEKRLWTFAARIKNANKKLRACGQQEVKADDFEFPSDDERVKELEEMVQARDIEIENMREQVKSAEESIANAVGENQVLREELNEAERALKEAVSDVERLEGNLMNTSDLLKDANESVEKLKEIAKEYVDEVSDRNQRIKELEAELAEVKATCTEERNTVNELLVKPNYYVKGGIECKDLIAIMLEDVSGINAFNLGNALKYLWRWQGKNGAEDIAKAITYLEELKNGISEQTAKES